ncbi:tyrosine--tRNA ligase [Candidatus Acetothermia bacterium]|nr:tyrosine--tRNA ligase [Candidatus Acetothermia bacterium]MBI3644247.1 tyrosine--tRNA ligase [Candidatus Acetothermia bacterium]
MKDVKAQFERLKRRAADIVPEQDLLEKLKSGKILRAKLGVDPTSPDLHLGHSLVLRKLRDFQELGHQAVLIVGDFTARIGDPSDRDSTRPVVTQEAIEKNMKTYTDQAFLILDPIKTEIRYNSEWLDKLRFQDVLELAARYTVARMLERDDFEKRFEGGQPITIKEFLYPLAQAYDSVAIKADVELGGTDQRFNLLVGREIQERFGLSPQVTLTSPLLIGTDGTKKMSKSLGNSIGIAEAPNTMFGKVMSIPDSLLEQYVILLTDLSWPEVQKLHPMEQKKRLAREIVQIYHDADAADAALEEFARVFSRKERPNDVTQVVISKSELNAHNKIGIVQLLTVTKLVSSKSDARRLVEQGAVELDGQRIGSVDDEAELRSGMLLRVGKKRFAEIKIE